MEWKHTDPNTLLVKSNSEKARIYRTGDGYVSSAAVNNTRVPAGHPEGYLEAFANIYVAFSRAVKDHQRGELKPVEQYDVPLVADGARGVEFICAMIKPGR